MLQYLKYTVEGNLHSYFLTFNNEVVTKQACLHVEFGRKRIWGDILWYGYLEPLNTVDMVQMIYDVLNDVNQIEVEFSHLIKEENIVDQSYEELDEILYF